MNASLPRPFAALVLAVTLVALPSHAHAQQSVLGDEPTSRSSSPSAAPAPAGRSWYGWQTLVADGASVTAFAGALALYRPSDGAMQDASAALLVLAGAGYLVGAPAVHLAHDAPVKAAGSFGLRLALPTAGLFAGLALGPRCSGLRCMNGLESGALGALLGVVGAVVVDAALLAFAPAPEATQSAGKVIWNVAPRADPRRGEVGVTLGAAGW